MALVRSQTASPASLANRGLHQAAAMVEWQERMERERQDAAEEARLESEREAQAEIKKLQQELQQVQLDAEQKLAEQEAIFNQRWQKRFGNH